MAKETDAKKAGGLHSLNTASTSDDRLTIEFPSNGEHLPLQRELVAGLLFVDGDGNPIKGAPVVCSWENASPPDGSPDNGPKRTAFTDGDGRAQWSYRAEENVTVDFHATVTDPVTNKPYYASAKGVVFSDEFNGPGKITLRSEDGTELTTDVGHVITAHYTRGNGSPANGEVLIWGAGSVPIYPLATVVRNGYASSVVQWESRLSSAPPRNVTVHVSSENPQGNDNRGDDVADLPGLNFHNALPLGLAVDKTFAANSFDGQFHPDQAATTIQASLEVTPAPGEKENHQIALTLSQFGAPVKLFGEDDKPLPKDKDGNYLATVGSTGRCSFQIMSPVFSLFTLTASYKKDGNTAAIQASSQLIIADLDNSPPGDIAAPRIQGLSRGVLTINPALQTFNVSMDMDDNDNIDDNATIALLLNGRIVFTGTGSDLDEKNGGVQIAYACLRADTFNELIMVYNDAAIFRQRTFASNPVRFTISGALPSEPKPGSRRVRAPTLWPTDITAWDVSSGVRLVCADGVIEPDMTITVLCFIEDSDPHAQTPKTAVQFYIKPEERFHLNFIPPIYLAGYSNGSTLRVYYSIVFGAERLWSDVATATLNTASIPQGRVPARLIPAEEQ
jgi:hypothetical protein